MEKEIKEIDDILSGFGDWMDGENGNECKIARLKLIELKWKIKMLTWVPVSEEKPRESECINGIEMPYECRYSCHRVGDEYISDESNQSVVITHWQYTTKPKCV